MAQNRIITISREFGSGGHTIGKMVAEQLGLPCYDKELVKQIASETGFDESYIEEVGEHAPGKSWLAYALGMQSNVGVTKGLSMNDFLWTVQYKIITELADKEPCVIIGRCADYILKGRDDCFDVFIHGDTKTKAERIVKLYGETEQAPEKRLADKDKKRKVYYKHYTGREWGMSQNYHMSLDSSKLGIEECARIIIEASGMKK